MVVLSQGPYSNACMCKVFGCNVKYRSGAGCGLAFGSDFGFGHEP